MIVQLCQWRNYFGLLGEVRLDLLRLQYKHQHTSSHACLPPGMLSSTTAQQDGSTPILLAAMQEQTRRRLPGADLVGAVDVAFEIRQQPGEAERQFDLLQRAVRGQAERHSQRLH